MKPLMALILLAVLDRVTCPPAEPVRIGAVRTPPVWLIPPADLRVSVPVVAVVVRLLLSVRSPDVVERVILDAVMAFEIVRGAALFRLTPPVAVSDARFPIWFAPFRVTAPTAKLV